MILRTVESVLEQDWPRDCCWSSSATTPATRFCGMRSRIAPVLYHLPPPRWSPGRDGAAKAGNLNSAVEFLRDRHPGIEFVETADADDEVGSTGFLRHVRRPARARSPARLRADDQGSTGRRRRSVQQPRSDVLSRPDAGPQRGERRLPVRVRAGLAEGPPSRRSATFRPGTWSRTCSPGSRRCGAAGAVLICRSWARCRSIRRTTSPTVYKQRGTWALDTTRLVVWGGARRPQPQAATPVPGTSLLLPRELYRPHLSRRAARCAARLRASRRRL